LSTNFFLLDLLKGCFILQILFHVSFFDGSPFLVFLHIYGYQVAGFLPSSGFFESHSSQVFIIFFDPAYFFFRASFFFKGFFPFKSSFETGFLGLGGALFCAPFFFFSHYVVC